MAKVVNFNRSVNAKLGKATLTTYGRHFSIQEDYDGWSVVDVNAPAVPTNIKEYLEGNTEITTFAIPANVESLCSYALASFPNVATIYITNYEEMVDLSATNVFGGLVNNPTIYVPSKFLTDYETEYPSYNFDTWLDQWTLYISNNGSDTLTVDYVNGIVYGLTNSENLAVTLTRVGDEFTTFEFGAMDFVFDGRVPNSTIQLDNEILFLSSAFLTSQSGTILEVE